MSVRAIQMQSESSETALDRAVMERLCDAVGPEAFDELVEDAIFEVTERIARIESLAAKREHEAIARVAHDLVAVAGQIGLSSVSRIASQLEHCAEKGEDVPVQAISLRLSRIGEASLVAAAELSVELGRRGSGLCAS